MLLKEVRKVKELNSSREGWDIDRTVLFGDIEAIKKELQELDSGGGNMSLLQDYIQHLQELTRRWTLIQALEEDGLAMPQISDNIPNEVGAVTLQSPSSRSRSGSCIGDED